MNYKMKLINYNKIGNMKFSKDLLWSNKGSI